MLIMPFLYDFLDERSIYPTTSKFGVEEKFLVYKLNKAIYDFKQAPGAWFEHLDALQSASDSGLVSVTPPCLLYLGLNMFSMSLSM